jgi:hypothetical protein
MQPFVLSCVAAFVVGVLVLWAGRTVNSRLGRTASLVTAALLVLYSSLPVWWLAASALGDGTDRAETIHADIDYQRQTVHRPKRAVTHVATVDLDSACVGFTTTVPDSTGETDALTGTEFVAGTGALVSINVAFFYPFEEYPHWSTYPTSGDPVTAIGYVVADGMRHGTAGSWGNHLILQPDDAGNGHQATIGTLPSRLQPGSWAIPGRHRFVQGGQVAVDDGEDYPRAAVAVDVDTDTLFLVVADGKQPGYSNGLDLVNLGEFLVELGADEALELDGGGSATMAATLDGEVELLSRPSHTRIPGRQRPVASHFGIVDQCRP